MHPLTRKRKLNAANPDDQPQSPVLVPALSPKPKRPRLSLPAPRRRSSPLRKPSPRPKPRSPSPAHYSLHHRSSHPHSLLSPLVDSPISPTTTTTSSSTSTAAATPHPSPALLPPITRDTLRELDLDAILRNPQLRHDLLFDPGLQFRPTSGRRKLLAAEHYWAAVAHELQHAPTSHPCPCHSPTKRARPPTPPPWSTRYAAYLAAAADPRLDDPAQSQSQSPHPQSRIPVMLHELITVLASVIVPPPLAAPPTAAADARALLAHLDPDLIAQELRRGLFDPAGLFALVGTTLKRHCAPMRDHLVDAMVHIAQGPSTDPDPDADVDTPTHRALRTIRTCFEILELMKLDIANHQLQHLRPFLAASTPDFELHVFIEQCRRGSAAPRLTRAWLQRTWAHHRTHPHPHVHAAPRRTRIHRALVYALTDLIFSPVPPHMRPETLYLDAARVTLLERDAADLTALYMLLMLWRQLVFWRGAAQTQGGSSGGSGRERLEDWEVDRVKREIWEVGPRRIGSCFVDVEGSEAHVRWTHAMQSVALQIAMRAEEARTLPRPASPPTPTATRTPPSEEALSLMQGWIASHLTRDSPLGQRLRTLLRDAVVCAVLGEHAVAGAGAGAGAGLEPLGPEIRHLAGRVGKLVQVNMRVYGSLYDAEGFLGEDGDGDGEGEGELQR